MRKRNKLMTWTMLCAMALTTLLGAGALADDTKWVPNYEHNGHAHSGYETSIYAEESDPLAEDPAHIILTEDVDVYGSLRDETPVTALSAGDAVCCIETYSSGWMHVYYADGAYAGWIHYAP